MYIFPFFLITHFIFCQSVYELERKLDSLHNVQKYEEPVQVELFTDIAFIYQKIKQ